jgi:hypothetical protein
VIRYLELDDFVETAAAVLDLPEETVAKVARLDLAESALHPSAVDDPEGEETFRRMVAAAATRNENLEAVEAEVAGWIAERLRPRPSAVD